METKEVLCEVFKIAWEAIQTRGKLHTSLHDGKVYTCFISIIQEIIMQTSLKRFVPANQLIMIMQHLLDDSKTPAIVKERIQKIFEMMDPRDQNYRFSKDCDCPICKPSPAIRKLWEKITNIFTNPN